MEELPLGSIKYDEELAVIITMPSNCFSGGVYGGKVVRQDYYIISYSNLIAPSGTVIGNFAGEFRDSNGYLNHLACTTNFSSIQLDCFMVISNVFHELGGLGSEFSGQLTAIDFCLRLRVKGGFNACIPEVVLRC